MEMHKAGCILQKGGECVMFGFGEKEKSLYGLCLGMSWRLSNQIMITIWLTLIEFLYNGQKYRMGSCVLPANEEEKEGKYILCFSG